MGFITMYLCPSECNFFKRSRLFESDEFLTRKFEKRKKTYDDIDFFIRFSQKFSKSAGNPLGDEQPNVRDFVING